MREAVLELKEMYRELWLAENRPYWLENVLARYDHEAQFWTRMALLFSDVSRDYRSRKALPAEEELGLVLP